MIKVKPKYIILYLIGIFLFIFGNRDFLEKIQEEEKAKQAQKKLAIERDIELNKPFEIQYLIFDSIHNRWKNNHISFQTIVVKPDFNTPRVVDRSSKIEINDDENASDSF